MKTVTSINGKIVAPRRAVISVFDRGLLVGYGAFETILALDGRPIWLKHHLRRIGATIRALSIANAPSQQSIELWVRAAARAFGSTTARLRLAITAGSGEMWLSPTPIPPTVVIIVNAHSLGTAPVKADLVSRAHTRGWLDEHKTLSWLNTLFPDRASARDPRRYIRERLTLVNTPDHGVTEFTSANLILRRGDRITIPPPGSFFPGVTLARALPWLKRKYSVTQRRVAPVDVRSADEIVAVSSLHFARALAELRLPEGRGHRVYRYPAPQLTPLLRAELARLARRDA